MNSKSSKGQLTVILDDVDPNSPAFKGALFRIGTVVRNYAVMELTRRGAVDEGYLRARISFRIESSRDLSRVIVGAFGVKYARMVEYGGTFTNQMRRAMFASFRERGKPKRPSKGVIKDGVYRARPYLGPAITQTRGQVNGILRGLIGKKGRVIG